MSFRQRHPVLFGLFIAAGLFCLFWAGLAYLAVSMFRPGDGQHALFRSGPGIGVVEVKGLIAEPEEILADLTRFRQDDGIKAVLLRIDSPGGAVGASQEIFQEVRRTDRQKPVVASMASIGASGGYYAALGAREIFANPGTLTGSMGVIVKFANLEELYDKIGYRSEVIKSGKLKDIGSSDRPMTEEERIFLQGLIDSVHGQFVRDVAESRGLAEEEVRKLADGRIFSGEQALDRGLVDRLGNFTEAVQRLAELAGLDPARPRLVYPERKGFSWLELLSGRLDLERLGSLLPAGAPLLSYEWQGGAGG